MYSGNSTKLSNRTEHFSNRSRVQVYFQARWQEARVKRSDTKGTRYLVELPDGTEINCSWQEIKPLNPE